ncbi:MAG: glycoside hydrolase family 95 protein [Oscillospiraceae bacterium]|nr:glycoside hydrolase family 95 protein [Oscillospiraceae bacterium]
MRTDRIYFDKPGDFGLWEQTCLPIGNGYMGASMFGGVRTERVVLNEKTFWAGGPCEARPDYYGGNHRDRFKYVRQVQEYLAAGENKKAEELLPMLTGDGDFGTYLLLCDMVLDFDLPDDNVSGYRRCLDLQNSLYTCEFTCSGVKHTREAFASYPARVLAFRFTASEKGALAFTLSLDKTHSGQITAENSTLVCSGAAEDNGLRFDARFRVYSDGEVVSQGDRLRISGASEAVVYFCAATDYDMKYPKYRTDTDPACVTTPLLHTAERLGWDALYDEHYNDYSSLFGRVTLKINDEEKELPADKLLEAYRAGDRAAMNRLETLYFSYGRYLLISSSRTGSLPANLQGVWNESNTPPWCCDYHINVNLQMNYWGAYNTNLAETIPPLTDFLNSLREPGRVTAKEYYGIESTPENPENGWTAHTQCSPFGWTAPGWEFYWGWSTAAVAWLMQNLWEHYEFTGNKDYLRDSIYPIMRESVKFYVQWLIYDKKQDRMVSSPTYSPEHGPATVGNTYEQSLIEQLFIDFLKASAELNTDPELAGKVRELLPMLKPYHIGKTGLLKEWYEEDEPDFDRSKVQKNHRHISHLMGLFPGKQINHSHPELMNAAIATMNDRGDESTGWARAYKINLWARTGDGDRTYKLLRGLLESCTFQNLWDFHPPFQIDGNFGASAGIAEMLIQSHEGVIRLLPALPSEWHSGSFTGLCARGGFVIDASWTNGEITHVRISPKLGGKCVLEFPAPDGKRIIEPNTEKGKTLEFSF